jgi:hypothetical protein
VVQGCGQQLGAGCRRKHEVQQSGKHCAGRLVRPRFHLENRQCGSGKPASGQLSSQPMLPCNTDNTTSSSQGSKGLAHNPVYTRKCRPGKPADQPGLITARACQQQQIEHQTRLRRLCNIQVIRCCGSGKPTESQWSSQPSQKTTEGSAGQMSSDDQTQ